MACDFSGVPVQVFLFVSLQKRVVGMAVVEPIKQAYRVAAAGELTVKLL